MGEGGEGKQYTGRVTRRHLEPGRCAPSAVAPSHRVRHAGPRQASVGPVTNCYRELAADVKFSSSHVASLT
jgi:hypothetical protein